MTLTGTRADGSKVTTALDLETVFQNYTLSGFTNLTSLNFSRASDNTYLTFDNIAVIPMSPVPEPASWAMLFLGVGAIGATMRTRRNIAGRALLA